VAAGATITWLGVSDAPRDSLAARLEYAAESTFSGNDWRYWSPAISADASRAEKRGESSMATSWVMMISSSSNASQSMSNRSPCW
jgi:hypothetical protein